MDFQIAEEYECDRLAVDELTYELTIRGIATGTCEEMRKLLSRARKLEKSWDSITWPEHPYTFEDDSKAVIDKLAELQGEVMEMTPPLGSNFLVRLETKMAHVMGRIDRVVPTDDDQRIVKSKIVAKVTSLVDTAEEKFSLFASKRREAAPIGLSVLEPQPKESKPSADESNIEPIPGPSGSMPRHSSLIPTQLQPQHKVVPVSKWGLQFSGDKKGMSVNAFLERVE